MTTMAEGRNETNAGAGIYVDAENLGMDEDIAQNVLKYALKEWDQDLPRITSISVYGKKVALWRSSLEGMVNQLQGPWPFSNSRPRIRVLSTESYSRNQEKNAADIKLAIDACQDMLSGAVSFIAVLSNDSDFFALYEKSEELKVSPVAACPNLNLGSNRNGSAFLLINHPVGAGVSPALRLVPVSHRKSLPAEAMLSPVVITNEEIAEAVIREIEIGHFGNSDIREILNGNEKLKEHRSVKLNDMDFDVFVKESIWPLLSERGVYLLKAMPALYGMSETAKDSLTMPEEGGEPVAGSVGETLGTSAQSQEWASSAQPGDEKFDEEFIECLAEKIPVGGFRAWVALRVIAEQWPQFFKDAYPNDYNAAGFDNDTLFPLIRKANSRGLKKIQNPRSRITRLYEITPEAKGMEGPTLMELATEIASKISLDPLSTDCAQSIIKQRWPDYQIEDNFRNWFYENIWPLFSDKQWAGTRRGGDSVPIGGIYRLDAADLNAIKSKFQLSD